LQLLFYQFVGQDGILRAVVNRAVARSGSTTRKLALP
jgi:hypothetical protein